MRAFCGVGRIGWGLVLALGVTSPLKAEPDPRRDVVVQVVERVMPCVVNIATEEIVEYRDPFSEMLRDFWGPYYRNRPRNTRYSLGSGVIIDEEGYVLTNLHVVQRATKVWVQLADGREFEAQPIVGTSRRDVALLKLVAPKDTKFEAIRFAAADALLLGETVLALGNPFGLGGSVSRGILSSKNRRPPLESEPLEIADWLQTDAAINPGSSGGPLVNLRGELIGLSVAVHREGQGIGFAIPVKQVDEALADILTPEVRENLWFGARLRGLHPPLVVEAVESGSPAAAAGLQVGDAVSQVNGKTPRSLIDFASLLATGNGQPARLAVERDGKRREVRVALLGLADLIGRRLGLTLQEMDPDVAQQFGLRPRQGLLVAGVDPDGPAAAAHLTPGQVILGIGGQATPDLLSAVSALSGLAKGQEAELSVLIRRKRGMIAQYAQGRAVVRLR